MGQSLTGLYYHIVFSTKHRLPMISDEVAEQLYPYLNTVVKENGGHLIRAGGIADHIHLLARLSKLPPLPDIVRNVKSNSSGWIHRAFPRLHAFGWQSGYGLFTVDATSIDRLCDYIDRQKEHHEKMSFQEEFMALLRRYEVPYDERYIWD